MNQKTIYLLIGLKGSGKSFIGTLFQSKFTIPFIRVEDWAKQVKRDRDISDESYLSDVFLAIENGIRQELKKHDQLVFESTGLTVYFDKMLTNLQSDFNVITIRINANPDTCVQRVRERDQSIHINVSDAQLREINSAALNKEIATDYSIDNQSASQKKLRAEIQKIISKIHK